MSKIPVLTHGVTTRQMAKKSAENEAEVKARGGTGDTRKSCGISDLAVSTYDASCRTFPLEHKGLELTVVDNMPRRQPRTETASKQKGSRASIADRGKNGAQGKRRPSRISGIKSKDGADQANKSRRRFETSERAAEFIGAACDGSAALRPFADMAFMENGQSDNEVSSTNGAICHESHDTIPEDIVDIDIDDNFIPATYSREVVKYWMRAETKWVLPPGFLDSSPEIMPRMRGVLMDWLLQVQDHEELQSETLHVCRVLIDRILAQGGVVMPRLQLLGITCLLVASKFCERFCAEIKVLCFLTDYSYTPDEVMDYEREVLVLLDWDVTRPVCTHFLERFLMVHKNPEQVEQLARYLLDLSVTNTKLACVLASKLAAAALLLARQILLPVDGHNGVPVWSRSLQFYTGYAEADLWFEQAELDTMLAKASNSKFQGARKKYNTKERWFISNNPRLERPILFGTC